MKKIIVMMLAVAATVSVAAQGIEFQQKPYAEVLAMAKEQNKLIFVDIFTSWCGPCRHMAKEVFPRQEVGEFYNANFLNMQFDAEKGEEGPEIAKKFNVTAFPTFLFINGDGELTYRFMGSRTPDKFISEGKHAQEAFASQPMLKKYAREYEGGNRDKKFLDEYCDLLVKGGLDCGNVLLEYFAQANDAELLDSAQVARISKLAVYDGNFARRLINVVLADSAVLKQDKTRYASVNKAVCDYIASALADVTRKADDEGFEEMLGLKDYYFKEADLKESVVMASLGGGNAYVPSNITRLKFYVMRKNADRLIPSTEEYMDSLGRKYAKEYETQKAMEAEMEKKLRELKDAGNQEEYDNLKKGYRMAFAFSKFDNNYIASEMVDLIGYYDMYYPGAKNEAYSKRLSDWYVLLCRMSPSAKNAVGIADKLLELGDKANARVVLQLGIDEGKEAVGVEQSNIDACREKLKEIS